MKKLKIIIITLLLVLSTVSFTQAEISVNHRIDPVGATVTLTDTNGIVPINTSVYTEEMGTPADFKDFFNKTTIEDIMSLEYRDMSDEPPTVIGIYYTETVASGIESVPNSDLTITPNIYGIVSTTKVGLFYHNGIAWDFIAPTVGLGTISVHFDNYANPSKMILAVYESTLAERPKPQVTITKINGIDKNGVDIIGTMTSGSDEDLSNYFGGKIPKPEGFPSTIINTMYPGVTNGNLVLLKFFDLDVSNELLGGVPLTFTFNCPSVNTNSKIYVLNYGEEWGMVEAEAGNGTVKAHFMHLSPVYIYADSTTLSQDEPEEEQEQDGPAPVMGDGPIVLAFMLLIISIIGMAVVIKKE